MEGSKFDHKLFKGLELGKEWDENGGAVDLCCCIQLHAHISSTLILQNLHVASAGLHLVFSGEQEQHNSEKSSSSRDSTKAGLSFKAQLLTRV